MYDTLIIGSGPAGMTAALYAGRANLKVGLIERGVPGGQMNNTADIENYPGFDLISGPELSMKMFEPLEKFGVEQVYGFVQKVEDHGSFKRVITEDDSFDAKTVILATGAAHRHLGVKGEADYNSRGVSYCAVCDGAFFRDQDLMVVGGGDSAVEEAIYLTQFAKSVTIIHRRDALRAQQILQQRAFANEKIQIAWNKVVEEVKGDDRQVTGLRVKDTVSGEISEVSCGGVFIYVGLDPVTEMVKDLGVTDPAGWVKTDARMATSVPGLYAIGDNRQKELRQITTAVGDGAIAGQEVYRYLSEQD